MGERPVLSASLAPLRGLSHRSLAVLLPPQWREHGGKADALAPGHIPLPEGGPVHGDRGHSTRPVRAVLRAVSALTGEFPGALGVTSGMSPASSSGRGSVFVVSLIPVWALASFSLCRDHCLVSTTVGDTGNSPRVCALVCPRVSMCVHGSTRVSCVRASVCVHTCVFCCRWAPGPPCALPLM